MKNNMIERLLDYIKRNTPKEWQYVILYFLVFFDFAVMIMIVLIYQ